VFSPQFPVRSKRTSFLTPCGPIFTFGAWVSGVAVVAALYVFLWFVHHDEKFPGFVFACVSVFLEGHLIFAVMAFMKRGGETIVYETHIEMKSRRLKEVKLYYWDDIICKPDALYDVWVEVRTRGEPAAFCFNTKKEGLVKLVSALDSSNGLACRNTVELRRAFLFGVLRTKPDARIDDDVYTLCRIDPATLEKSSSRLIFDLTSFVVGFSCLMWFIAQWGFSLGTLSLALTVGAMMVLIFVLIILTVWVRGKIFADPQSVSSVKSRLDLLRTEPTS